MTLWLSNIAAYSVQFAVLVATAALMTTLLGLRQPRAALMFWQSLLVVALLLPLIQPWSSASPDIVVSALSLSPASAAAPVTSESAPGVNVAGILAAVLATGIAIRLAWLVVGLIKLRQITRRARTTGDVAALFAEAADRVGTAADVRISDDVDGPATVGLRRPVVLLPARILALPDAQQRAVFCHELLHVRRGDWVNTVAEEVFCALLWFHPAARALASRICLARETVVDQEAITICGSRRAYAEALLAFSSPQQPRLMAATPFIRPRHLAQRIALVAQEVSMSRPRLISIVTLAGAVVLLAGAAAMTQFPIATTLSAQSKAKGRPVTKVYKPGPGSGVTLPKVLSEDKPSYTPAAMQAKIQGSVWMTAVVLEDGTVTDVKISRSLDDKHGLDQEAIKSAKKWRFEPGRKDGKPVAVEITVEMTFTLK
jgi:TonB family protein